MCISSVTVARESPHMTHTPLALVVVALAERIVAGDAEQAPATASSYSQGRHHACRGCLFHTCPAVTCYRADGASSPPRAQRHVQALHNLMANSTQGVHIINSVVVGAETHHARRQYLRAAYMRRIGCHTEGCKDMHCKTRSASIRHEPQPSRHAPEQASLHVVLHTFSDYVRSLCQPCQQGRACTGPHLHRWLSVYLAPITMPPHSVLDSGCSAYGRCRIE